MDIGIFPLDSEESPAQQPNPSGKEEETFTRPPALNSKQSKKLIFLFIIVGILGCSILGISRNLGIFTGWEKIPDPPARAQRLFARGLDFSPLLIQAEGNQVYELHLIYDRTWENSSTEFNSVFSQSKKLTCDLSIFPFSILKRKFSIVTDCSEVVVPGLDFVPPTQYIFVLDQAGTIWVWTQEQDFSQCLPYYVGSGAFLGLFAYVIWRAIQWIKTRV